LELSDIDFPMIIINNLETIVDMVFIVNIIIYICDKERREQTKKTILANQIPQERRMESVGTKRKKDSYLSP
jgi:hypothetical protein